MDISVFLIISNEISLLVVANNFTTDVFIHADLGRNKNNIVYPTSPTRFCDNFVLFSSIMFDTNRYCG